MTETNAENYQRFFSSITGHGQPHGWQAGLARGDLPENRLIRIPTGFGKTQGVLSTWLWNRLIREDDRWPRRLV
jgi:CRISPR-associated endonuclease/helicase Cas3